MASSPASGAFWMNSSRAWLHRVSAISPNESMAVLSSTILVRISSICGGDEKDIHDGGWMDG